MKILFDFWQHTDSAKSYTKQSEEIMYITN